MSIVQTPTALVTTPIKAAAAFVQNASKPVTPTPETFPPSPGTFRHPRLTEIIARQNASSFTSRNIQNVLINSCVLALTFILNSPIYRIMNAICSTIPISTSSLDPAYPVLVIRGFLLLNIVLSTRPVIPYMQRKDEIDDIPLTPSQRALLGLPPSAKSTPTGSAGCITPPRYRRTSGSGINTPSSADRRSVSANYGSSPLSTSRYTIGFSPSPQQSNSQSGSRSYRRASDSPFSPSASTAVSGSPLLHKTLTQNQNQNSIPDFVTSTASGTSLGRSQSMRDGERRGSGQDFGLSTSTFRSSMASGPGTPSPSGRRPAAAQGGLNYKWLYEKSARAGPTAGLTRSESMGF